MLPKDLVGSLRHLLNQPLVSCNDVLRQEQPPQNLLVSKCTSPWKCCPRVTGVEIRKIQPSNELFHKSKQMRSFHILMNVFSSTIS
jgi:hypothetical protein